MKWFFNLKISQKLISAFVLVAVIAGVIGVIGIINLKKIDRKDTELYEKMTAPMETLAGITESFQRLRGNVRDMMLANTQTLKDKYTKNMEDRKKEIEADLVIVEGTLLTEKGKELIKTFEDAHKSYLTYADQIVSLENQGKHDQAVALLYGDADKAAQTAQTSLESIVSMKSDLAEAASKSNTATASSAVVMMVVFMLVGIIAAIILGFFTSRIISNPIKKLVSAADKMALGDVNVDIKADTRDEIGTLVTSFGKMADNIKEQAAAAERIASGDLAVEVKAKSDNDVLAKSMQMVVESLRNLIAEAAMLSKAAVEGKLDTRGNPSKFMGGYREIVEGVNNTLDAVIGPLNVAAEYVDRISKGDIPPRIADTYYGDFNEIKNNLNVCIDALNMLLSEMQNMSRQHDAGDIDVVVPEDKFEGAFKEMAHGVNNMVSGHITVKKKAMACIAEFVKGNLNAELERFPGKKAFINDNIEALRKNIKDVNSEINLLIAATHDGRLTERADVQKFQGDWAVLIKGLNGLVDAFVSPINVTSDYIDRISKGDIPAKITDNYNGDFNKIKNNLNTCIDAVNALITDTNMLVNASLEGRLETRADASRHGGDFGKIVQGVNDTLDAVIAPVKEAAAVLQEMSKGNLQASVTGNYKGDHAAIKDALNFSMSTIFGYISEISKVLTEMSEGNLTVGITGEYLGDFVEIKNSLNQIIKAFNEVLGDINTAAEQVSTGSRQVSDSSQALSQGSTEQASSIEELTASMTEIAAQTKQNAVNANQANELASAAKMDAVKGNDRMKEMIVAMKEINDSSGNISKIIKVIDEIAFQTNILALNAAVEAARSANAAKETTALIEGSIHKVEEGTKIANETGGALNQIVDGVTKAADLVADIATASNEQATGIAQVNQGINQVSQVTQTNSATAEESAAASEELSSQAEILKEMVAKFKLKKGGSMEGMPDINPDILRMLENANQKKKAQPVKSQGNGRREAGASKSRIALGEPDFGKY